MGRTKSSDGWEDVDSGAVAMSTVKADYKQGGKHFVESGFDFNTASAKEIKAKLGDMKPGETRTLNQAHSWKLQKQISSAPGEKSCRFRLVESDGLDGNSEEVASFMDPVIVKTGPLGVAEHFLKNMIDKLSDRVGINTALAVSGIVLGALALGLALT